MELALRYEGGLPRSRLALVVLQFLNLDGDELSDVNNTTVGAERLRCAEVLFQPYSTTPSFQNMMKRDVDVRKELFASVVLAGGTARIDDISFQNNIKCDVNVRKELFASVVLSGDTARIDDQFLPEHHEVARPLSKGLSSA